MADHKTVCFSCLTSYHVFVSYVLSKTAYKNDHKILLISDHHLKKVYENSCKLNVWDEIILIEEKYKPFQLIQPQLNKIDLKNIDILHYFSWGSILNGILMSCVFPHTKIILTDEGFLTYYPKEASDIYRSRNKLPANPIDFNKIAEIWLFDTSLYISELNKPLKNIGFREYIESDFKFELCDELNILFDYKYEKKDYDIIFFDQCLTLMNKTSHMEERYLLSNILDTLKNYKVFIKKHPSDSKDKYTGFDVDVLEYTGIPWEVIYLNEYINDPSALQNKIYMTYCSTAMINTRALFKDAAKYNYFISLSKLLRNLLNITEPNILLDKYYDQFRKTFNETIYEAESFEGLKNIMDNVLKKAT